MFAAASSARRLLLLALLALSAGSVSAQLTLGYCNDEEGYTSSLSNNSTTATISCAMGLTPALQADYTFCSISYLRIYLTAPENFTSLTVWLREDLDKEDLTAIDVEPSSLVAGWNDIALPDSIRVTAASTLYCGYSYRQSAKTAIPTSGTKSTAQSFYVSTGNAWRDMSDRYAPVCIRAGLCSNYQNAMQLTDLRLDHRWFDISGDNDTVVIRGSIRNLGSVPLHHFSITVEETDVASYAADYDCDSTSFGFTVPFEFRFRRSSDIVSANPDIPVRLTIVRPNGHDNQSDLPVSRTLYYELGESNHASGGAPANLLIEEFTSESNGYAPAGQTHLRQSIGRAMQRIGSPAPDVIIISRHEGYGPADGWRTAGSDYDASFFGPEQLTFAPAAMVCRNGLPFSTTLDEDSLALLISQRLNVQYGRLQFDALSFDAATRTLSATITTHLNGISVYTNPTLVVCIKQDRVPSIAQKNYYPTLYDNDWQLDVVRCFIPLPHDGRLLADEDLLAVATGQVPISGYSDRQFDISQVIPSDIISTEGLTLVAYIFDNNYTNRIIAVAQSEFR